MIEFIIDEEYETVRIDRFLRKHLKNIALSEIYKMLRKAKIKVNNKKVSQDYRLVLGDIIFVFLPESFEIKNYLVKNYDNMTSVIGKQAVQRANELPKETIQRVIIDARGQSLGKTVQEQMLKKEQVIDDIVRKSNGIIKKENILFWE